MYYQGFLTSTNVLSENPGWYKCTIELIENDSHSLPAVILSPFTGRHFVSLPAVTLSPFTGRQRVPRRLVDKLRRNTS